MILGGIKNLQLTFCANQTVATVNLLQVLKMIGDPLYLFSINIEWEVVLCMCVHKSESLNVRSGT